MRIQRKADGQWRPFTRTIEDFEYQGGMHYRIRVGITPADAHSGTASERYTLLDILSRKPIELDVEPKTEPDTQP
ncbi:hypothetical protein GP5015_148 [gamma proteobacterium HTCC5015]|nr:hypothetical protein GP5015_148 [gamma proteobacterium HTCC5015]